MQFSNEQFDARLDLVQQSPGVYLMKDASGSIIYVGKAVNLRARLRSYFTKHPQGTAKVLAMISHISDFDTIYCANELEALILESTLIKQHQPRYNILLRDDRDYPYIKVTLNETYPRVVKAFRIGRDADAGARYFGPYLSGDVFRAIRALRSIFPMKTCRRVLPRDIGKERPCLNYHIGRCIGPCKGDVSVEDYRTVMVSICRFLEGHYKGLVDSLKDQMKQASEAMAFEQAASIRDRIQALEKLMEKQQVVTNKDEDRDVLGLARNGSEIALQKLEIRQGRLVAAAAVFWPENDQTDADVLSAFISQHYPAAALIPPRILLSESLEDHDALEAFLSRLRNGACRLVRPQRGNGRRLIEMARTNAVESLRRHTLLGGSGQTALQEALRLLAGLAANDRPLHRIEAFDISNTGQEDRAASMVVFRDGKPQRQQYRRFRLEDRQETDDYAAMRDVVSRRLGRLSDDAFGQAPDLILVDGGNGHVKTVKGVVAALGLDLPVAGMVKDKRHRTRGLALGDRVIELRTDSFGVDAAKVTDQAERIGLLRLLTAIQDEAHRFAGRYRSHLQHKRQTRYSLEGIDGIGPARRKLLLKHFSTIRRISQASLDDLNQVQGLGQQAAQAVYSHFHSEA